MLDTYELFVNSSDLPGKLTKEELYELLGKMQKGSLKARDEIIVHNVRLVLYVVGERFKSFTYLKKDLVASGNIGLIKAVDTYDMSRGVEFSTYAFRCINNEILQFLKKLRIAIVGQRHFLNFWLVILMMRLCLFCLIYLVMR